MNAENLAPTRTSRYVNAGPFVVGSWRVEPALGRISCGDDKVALEPKTMAVLQYLAQHPDKVISGEQLIEVIWEGRPMGDNPVYRCIAQLRKAFGDQPKNPDYIATVPKRGYRLLATVEPVAEQEPIASGSLEAETRPPGAMRAVIFLGPALLAVLALVLWSLSSPDPATGTGDPVLAVMPFDFVGERPAGMLSGANTARAIAERLSSERALQVISFDSAAVVGRAGVEAPRAAQMLGASHLLEGALELAAGNRILASLNLLDASGQSVWARRIEYPGVAGQAPLEDIAGDVAEHFGIRISPMLFPGCRGTRNRQACQSFLLAHEHLVGREDNYRVAAIELMQRAIAQDPAFAAAHADLAMLYLMPGAARPWQDVMALAGASIERALELDPELAEAHAARGLFSLRDPNWPCPPVCFRTDLAEAEVALRTAIKLNPGLARSHHWMAIVLYAKGEFGAAQSGLERALGYDPMNPVLHHNSALFAAFRGEAESAKRMIDEFRAYHPNPPEYLLNGRVLVADLFGDFDESLRIAGALQQASGVQEYSFPVANAYLNLGMFDEVAAHVALSDAESLIESSTLSVLTGYYSAQNDGAALARLADDLHQASRAAYGEPSAWPRSAWRLMGKNFSLAGDHVRAIDYFGRAYGDLHDQLDYQSIIEEFDGMLLFAHSLGSEGRGMEADALSEAVLEIFASMERQGYAGLPDLVYLKAVAHALRDERALATATLRSAISQGWRRYWLISSDPRWSDFRQAADFNQLLAEVRAQVASLRASLEPAKDQESATTATR